jgi:hypothetical protein
MYTHSLRDEAFFLRKKKKKTRLFFLAARPRSKARSHRDHFQREQECAEELKQVQETITTMGNL